MRIALTTPTGQIGRRTLEQLLPSPHALTVIARDPARLPAAARARAQVVQGSLEDAEVVRRGLAGADAAFLLVPPNFGAADWLGWMRGIGANFANGLRASGVRRAVVLSSLGADRPGIGPVSVLGEVEELVRAAAPDVLALRAGYFMENLLGGVGSIRAEGAFYQAHPTNQPIPFIATRDIGDAAAAELADVRWSGHRRRELLGPADVTLAQVAQVISAEIGTPVRHVEAPLEAVRQAVLGMGATEDVAARYVDLLSGLNAMGFAHGPRTAATTTPTTIEAFVREVLAPAVRQG